MKTRRLGKEGPEVSAIGLGGMYLSIVTQDGRPDEAQAIATVHAALDAGVTLIDTADVYCRDDGDIGHNEALIAKALRARGGPKGIIVATKGGLRRPNGAWTRDARPERLAEACEHSLKTLGVDVIDLYQLHAPDDRVPFVDSVGALAKLREQGKIARVGLSNVTVEQIEAALKIVPITSVQNRWNPWHRNPENDGVLAACERLGLAFLAYSPLAGATGAKSITAGWHQKILAWMLHKSPIAIPIPGARRPASITDSAAAADYVLSPAEADAIEGPSRAGK
jgi:aryl-alcohol dehydrogenase-like predicted oxidoreductase